MNPTDIVDLEEISMAVDLHLLRGPYSQDSVVSLASSAIDPLPLMAMRVNGANWLVNLIMDVEI